MAKEKMYFKCIKCTSDENDGCVLELNYDKRNTAPKYCPYGDGKADFKPHEKE